MRDLESNWKELSDGCAEKARLKISWLGWTVNLSSSSPLSFFKKILARGYDPSGEVTGGGIRNKGCGYVKSLRIKSNQSG